MSRMYASLLLLVVAPTTVGATCPLTRWIMHSVEATAPEPVGSRQSYSPTYPYDGDGTVSWNAPQGTLSVHGCSGGRHGWAGGQIWTTDEFEIVGAPPGQSVRVRAAVDVSGRSWHEFGVGSSSWGELSDDAGRSVTGGNADDGVTIRLELPLDMLAGVPQRLTYMAYGSAIATCADTGVRLLFLDVPPGMSIVSCRGFQTGAVTATRPTSWGRLKQIYR